MYRAKELGRNTTQFYRPDMQRAAKDRMAMENDLREALQRNEMELYFQPQLDADGRNVAAEALLRWHHTERGMVSPAEFIPVAEDTGIILELGEWVLITACAQLKSWMELADRGVIKQFPTISVNVSPRQFRQQNFLQRVQQVIEQSNVDPRCVELELTESMLIDDIEDTAHKMEQLARLGVRLAIDDFGTGYSSLHYLKKLQLHRIKIDQSFVRNVHTDAGSAVIVKTIILMAHNLGLEVIAEGVETEAELRFLRENGCLNYQGYYFSKPLPGDMFLRYLQTGN
jgi:EAL domain-containing protein (putative c-di-GMP-specific phosphodiesterase class I)